MVVLNKSITVNGASMINDGQKDVQVAYMSASIPVGGNANINRAIQNKALFDANKEDVLKDFAAFDEYVYGLMEEGSGEQEG